MILGREKIDTILRSAARTCQLCKQNIQDPSRYTGKYYNYLHGDDTQKCFDVLSYTWAHPEVIDEYLGSDGNGLSEEDKQIVADWKRCRPG